MVLFLKHNNNIKTNLQNNIILCQNYLQTLHEVSCERNEILQWFQGFCNRLTDIIVLIGSYHKQVEEKPTTFTPRTILLYLTQIITSLSLLINVFVCEEETTTTLVEIRKCVIRQVTCCLESIETGLDCGNSLTDPSGNFVKWMDAALEKVAEISINNNKAEAIDMYKQTRQIFEEVLSHAMSIAQVSLPDDGKIIRGSCQSVLSTLSCLETEINNTAVNSAMINLFIDACSDKLCILEKKVNTAVLQLCLKSFSQFTVPLEKIHNFCFNSSNKRKTDEFDSLVADFDLHVDRVMQIGLFAVSCSSDFTRGIKIRSCLASLEALENELVPALTAVLLDNSLCNISCATILMKHWLDQAVCLQQLIYLIIEPFAFCQVVYEKATEIVDDLSNSVRKKQLIKQHDVHGFISMGRVLQSFLEKAQSEFSEKETNKVKGKLKDYKEVLDEVEKASTVLLTDHKNDVENCKRVLKRCKILLTVLKRLWFCFVDDTLPHQKDASIVLEKQVADLHLKLENLQMEPTGNPFIDHIINRGKQILQDRSVLYRTPAKNISTKTKSSASIFLKDIRKEIPLSKLVHLRKFSFMNGAHKNETSIDLQITAILNDMTNLTTSFKPQDTPTKVKTDTKTIQETSQQF